MPHTRSTGVGRHRTAVIWKHRRRRVIPGQTVDRWPSRFLPTGEPSRKIAVARSAPSSPSTVYALFSDSDEHLRRFYRSARLRRDTWEKRHGDRSRRELLPQLLLLVLRPHLRQSEATPTTVYAHWSRPVAEVDQRRRRASARSMPAPHADQPCDIWFNPKNPQRTSRSRATTAARSSASTARRPGRQS